MAILESKTGERIELWADHLVGRSSQAHLQLTDPAVSSQHAAIRWSGTGWQVHDLGSRNGTWLEGRRLPAQEWVELTLGDGLGFGGPAATYTLVDVGPPRPLATTADGHQMRGDGTFLALPSEDDPAAVITLEADGWTLSMGEVSRALEDGDTIDVAGASYTLSLPLPVARTIDATPTSSDSPGLRFAVSADEEYVEVTVQLGDEVHRLPARAHQYALLVLARARLDDIEQDIRPAEAGWTYTASLAEQLRVTMNRLYVMVHRCRKEIDALQAGTGATLIERRATTHQVRLGWCDLRVDRLG